MKKSDVTRQRIISSAEILFYSKGVVNTSQQEIANLAGVNRGLIHHYFGSKQALALMISRKFCGTFYNIVHELYFKDETDVILKSIAQGRILFNTLFSNHNFERFFMEEVHGRIISKTEEETPVYRDFLQECAYLGLDYSQEEMTLYSMAISSVEHKLFAAKINKITRMEPDDILDIYNRIHLNILGITGQECENLIFRATQFSKMITFVNDGNFDVKPEFFNRKE